MRAPMPLLCLALLAGCLTDEPSTPTPPAGNASDDGGAMEPEAIQVAVGRGGEGVPPTLYTLSPARLELAVGTAYSLTLRNDDPAGGHDLAIDELDVHIDTIGAGETSEPVVFTPTEAGTFKMYCTIGGDSPLSHDAQGMHGEVVVS